MHELRNVWIIIMINEFRGKYRFLSNFYQCETLYLTQIYPTVEHAYQASKTTDWGERQSIRNCKTPTDAKRLGKIVSIRSDWEEIKDMNMYLFLRQKFIKDDFKKMLLDTGDEELIEGNMWHDTYWGICYCDKCSGNGLNKLGNMLMVLRSEAKLGILE